MLDECLDWDPSFQNRRKEIADEAITFSIIGFFLAFGPQPWIDDGTRRAASLELASFSGSSLEVVFVFWELLPYSFSRS